MKVFKAWLYWCLPLLVVWPGCYIYDKLNPENVAVWWNIPYALTFIGLLVGTIIIAASYCIRNFD